MEGSKEAMGQMEGDGDAGETTVTVIRTLVYRGPRNRVYNTLERGYVPQNGTLNPGNSLRITSRTFELP